MNDSSSELLEPAFLFRFAAPCRYRQRLWAEKGVRLSDAHRLPWFGELEGRQPFADVRAAWSRQGLLFVVRVAGKQEPPFTNPDKLYESDGVEFWINTREAHGVHRATRFCHRFRFLPFAQGPRLDRPAATLLAIHRAIGSPREIDAAELKARSQKLADGYTLTCLIPAKALTGFDPDERPRLGFTYLVADRELGWQPLAVSHRFPCAEDPSLWQTLELVKD